MPELPEVRWLQRNHQKELIGATIKEVKVSHHNVIVTAAPKPEQALNDAVKDKTVNFIDRRGKYLLIGVGPYTLLVHFSFTGWLIPSWATQSMPRRFLHPMDPDKHTRVLYVTDRGNLYLTDPRCLSRTWVFHDLSQALKSPQLKKMAPDADTPEGEKALREAIKKTGRRIRDLIMDQQTIAGVGNYLCCEALYLAALHGHEPAKKLPPAKVDGLIEAIQKVIRTAETYDHHDWWSVFRRSKCPNGHIVTREAWSTRGHYLCYTCQGNPSQNNIEQVAQPTASDEDPLADFLP